MDNYVHIKIIIVGDQAVGKSSLITQYIDAAFRDFNVETHDYKIKKLNIQNQQIKLCIWDTAGQERYESITGAVVCFDLSDYQSFENVKKWIRKLRVHAQENIQRILVGTKNDLPQLFFYYYRVPQNEINQFCKENQLYFCATSAKNNQGVNTCMETMVKLILDQNQFPQIKQKENILKRNKIRFWC